MSIFFRKIFLLSLTGISVILTSCSSSYLSTDRVAYQSVRTTFAQPDDNNPIPEEVEIIVAYSISGNGDLTAIVFNRTDEIMTIDQTKSFFVNSNGVSTSYYDPTVRTTSTTNSYSSTTGGSVNLGAVAGAFGVGGPVGTLLGGVNVGGASTDGTSTTYITQVADLPEVSLSPHSQAAMSKVYNISGIGGRMYGETTSLDLDKKNSYCTFSVCISYSIDDGKSYKKLVTYFYANSKIVVPVSKYKNVNDALRKIYAAKPDALNEPYYNINFNDERYEEGKSNYVHGILYDFQ